ncbi:MAG: TonB family protein [bacterium]
MKKSVFISLVILFCVSAVSFLFPGSIKKKNGQIVHGEIKSNVLLKGNIQKSQHGSVIEYTLSYIIINGEDIKAIDENGVHLGKSVVLLVIVRKENQVPNDKKIVEAALREIRLEELKRKKTNFIKLKEDGSFMVTTPVGVGKSLFSSRFSEEDVIRITKHGYGDQAGQLVKYAFEQREKIKEKYDKQNAETLRLGEEPKFTLSGNLYSITSNEKEEVLLTKIDQKVHPSSPSHKKEEAIPKDLKIVAPDPELSDIPPPPPPPEEVDEIHFIAFDEPPSPIGGFRAIQRALKYPEIARIAGIEGRVIVMVLVSETGEVVKTEIQKSLGHSGCDNAAVNAIKSVKWKPALQKDKPVKVWVAIPVIFKLK